MEWLGIDLEAKFWEILDSQMPLIVSMASGYLKLLKKNLTSNLALGTKPRTRNKASFCESSNSTSRMIAKNLIHKSEEAKKAQNCHELTSGYVTLKRIETFFILDLSEML